MDSGSERRALEEVWRRRLNAAKLRLDLARSAPGSSLQDLPAPDGQFANRQAIEEERFALREYMRVLEICHNLIVNGIIPEAGHFAGPHSANTGEGENQSE